MSHSHKKESHTEHKKDGVIELVEKAAALGLTVMNSVAGSKLAQDTGVAGLFKETLYLGSKTALQASAGVGGIFRQAKELVPTSKLRQGERKSEALFDLTFSEEQQLVGDMIAEFAAGVLRPTGKAADEGEELSAAFYEKIVQTGILGAAVPEQAGGAAYERSPVTIAMIAEKLGYGDYALSLKILSSLSVINLINDYGSDSQRARYLAPFVEANYVQASLAVMEKQLRFDFDKISCRAERSHSGFWLSGEKTMVISGESADALVVFARLAGAGIVPFIVEKNQPGLSWHEERHMGLKAASLATVRFENTLLPLDSLLGEGAVEFDLKHFIASSQVAMGALTVGTMKAAIDYAIEYCNAREAFGEPITNRQAVAFMLADMATEYEALRLMVYRAASRAEQNLPFQREAYLADLYASNYSMKVATDAVQLLGGHGFTREHPVELWYRQLRASAVLRGALYG